MFGFKRKPGRRGLRAALLAGTALAALGAGGLNPGSAMAQEPCAEKITGAGATLQKIAQEKWIAGFETPVFCEELPEVSYESIGSGAGRNKWLVPAQFETLATAFVATDEAATPTEIETINANAEGTGVLTIPVAQAAIGVAINPPANCTLLAITNKNLEKAFSGAALTWTEIGATGTGCGGLLTRVVRQDGSGTTFQFKMYLSQIEAGLLACTPGPDTWSDLAFANPNTAWPEDANCTGGLKRHPLVKQQGGGNVAMYVALNEGTIGYAGLADITAQGAKHVKIQNDGIGAMTTSGSPSSGSDANCAPNSSIYKLPLKPGTTTFYSTWKEAGEATNANWSAVIGSHPNVAGETGKTSAYPICTLTYAMAFNGYGEAGYPSGGEVGLAVKDYLNYVTSEEGQEAIEGKGYGLLFAGPSEAASASVNKIK